MTDHGPERGERFDLDELLAPVRDRRLRRLPRLLVAAFRLVHQAARRELWASGALQVVGGAGIGLQLLVGRRVLDELVRADDASFGAIVPDLVLLAVVSAAVAFAAVARAEQQRVLSELVARHATSRVLDVATSVDLLAFETPGFHDRLQRAHVNAVVRPLQMVSGVLGILGAAFAIAGIGAALLVLEPLLLLLVLVAYVPVWLAATSASRLSYRFAVDQTEGDRKRAYLVNLLIDKDEATEIRSYDLGGFLRARHEALYDTKIASLRDVAAHRLRLGLVGTLVTSALTAGTLAVLVWFVTSGRLDLAAAGAAAGAVVLLGTRLQVLASSASSLYESSLFLEDFTSFLGIPIGPRPPALAATTGPASVVARDLTFTYPSRAEPSLRCVSVEVGAGELIALVGENGSGKSTLAKVLAGLYRPDIGSVRWTGVQGEFARPPVAVVFQDFIRYNLTASENIGLGDHRRMGDHAAVVRAAVQAGADQVVRALDQTYDTLLGPEYFGGSDLSVGQWQRLALARAFFRDAPAVILDEPTAALDARAERELFESIRSLARGRTVIVISHRFSSVRSADRIYVLHEGRIVEHGSHVELMDRGGRYAEMFTMQAGSYLEPRVSTSRARAVPR